MRWFLLGSIFCGFAAAAQEDKNIEIRFIPGHLGYSSLSGLMAGHDFAVDLRLSSHWQWEFGARLGLAEKGRDYLSLFTGPRYNFSDDLSRSWFVFAGVEYGEDYNFNRGRYEKTYKPAAEVGKHFRLSESWSYVPSISYVQHGDSIRVVINPATFSLSF